MRGENDDGVLGNFLGAVDGDRAALFQILHYGFIVDDFVLDIDRRAENIERILDRLYRARHPRAKPARGGEKDFLDGGFWHIPYLRRDEKFCVSISIDYEPRIIPSTSSRFSIMSASVLASRLRRRSGSVLEGRTLNHQSGKSIFTPSRWEMFPSA